MIFAIRRAIAGDFNFIMNSWTESYRRSPFAKHIPKYTFHTNHHDLMEAAIDQSNVLCAVSKDNPDQIFGWVCFEPTETKILHYIYVKHPFRDLGIARKLLEQSTGTESITFTHIPEGNLGKTLFATGKYDPYKFFKGAKK